VVGSFADRKAPVHGHSAFKNAETTDTVRYQMVVVQRKRQPRKVIAI
jgi:hypothetical protein